MALNLKSTSVVETTRVHLSDATGEKLYDENGNPAQLEIFGKASKQYKNALAELSRKSLARKGKPQPFSVNVADNIDLLVAITKAAYNFDVGNGPLTTPDDFKALYSDASLFFIKDQAQEALEDNGNFTQK